MSETQATAPAPAPIASVGLRFLLAHPAHLIALGFGSGLARVAPGTAGTLWGWATFVLAAHWLTPLQLGAILLAALPLGWWACTLTARHLGVADPGAVVWDEIVAIWLILLVVMPAGWWEQLAAFALFRFFDAVKPGPVGWADARFKGLGWRGGLGILFDDLVAAFCTLLVLAFWHYFFG